MIFEDDSGLVNFLIKEIHRINPKVPKEISLTANLQDLGLDSLDLIEWVATIEQKLQIKIPDKDIEKFISVENTAAYLKERMESLICAK